MYLGIIELIVFLAIMWAILVVVASIQKWWNDKHFRIRKGDLDKNEKSPLFDIFMKNENK